jgi:hypothetical protein
MHLLTRSYAAEYWGWRNGMSFVNRECDEYFRDLIRYATQYHKSNGWHILPCFRRLFRAEHTSIHEDIVQLVLRPNMPRLYNAHSAWHLHRKADLEPPACVDSQYMFRLVVKFKQPPIESNDLPVTAFIHHMQTDPCCAFVRPDERFYYVHVHDWIARCSDPSEVVALLNAIQHNVLFLMSEHRRRLQGYMLYPYLENVLLKTNHDAPRRRYLQRTMEEIAKGWGECIWLAV